MAKQEELGSLIVRVGLDGAEFDAGIKNINARMALARSELKASASQFENFGRTIDTLRIKQENLAKQYQLQSKRVQQLKNQYDQLVKAHGAESDAALRAGARLNNAIATYNRMGNQLRTLTKDLRYQESGWHRAEQSIASYSNKMNKTGSSLLHVGKTLSMSITTPIVGLATAAVRTGMTFDQEMSKVKAISGATGSQFESMRKQAIELGASTTKSSTEVAAGMLEMSKAGFSVNQIMAAMPGVIAASEASGADMARTTEVVTAALNGFGLEASKAGHVADVLAATANKTNADIDDLGYAFKYAAPVAHTLGLSLEDVAAAAGIMANAGVKGEQAGTTLRMAMLRLADPPKDAANTIEQLGLKIRDSSGKMLPLQNIIAQLNEKTRDMSKTQKAAAISAIFGTEAMSGMVATVDAGPEAFAKLKKSLEESDGAAKKASQEMKDNFAGAVEQLKGTLESIGIQVSDELTPAIREVTKWLTNAGEKFQNLSPEARKLVIILGLVAAGIGPVTIGLAALFKSIGIVSGGIANSIRWLGKYRVEASLTNKSLASLGTTAAITGAKMNTANSTMSKTSKGMNAVKGGAIVAGGALAAFGGTWGTLAGIAVTFLPQIINVGKNILTFGKNATVSAGGIGGLALKVLGTIKNFASLSRIIGIARLGLGALGGPIGLTIAGVTLLTQGGIKLYQHLQQQSIPALTSFGNKVSESTTKAVLGYKKLNDQATAQLNQLYWSGTAISKQTANQLVNTFSQMGSRISQSLRANFNKDYQTISTFLQNSKNLSKTEQQQILNNMQLRYRQQQGTVQVYENKIRAIMLRASSQKRALTDAERKQINAIQQAMMRTAVQTMSKSEVEQKSILARLKAESGNITAQQAAQTVRNSLKARDGAIKAANDKYKRTVAAIIRERDETHSISKSQADKLIREAERQRDQAVKKANDMHNKVVSAAKKQAQGQVKEIDWSTGTVLTRWDKMVRGVAKGVNKLIDGLNWVLERIGLKKYKIDYWRPKGYAKGTPSSGHPGGPAIVGEKGPELAHIPGVGITMVGTQGPELIPNLPKGSSILPNKHTERLLKSYGFPGYEDGVGDFFKWVIKGPKALMENVWKKFDPHIPDLGGAFSLIGKGIISFLKDKSFSFIKDKLKDFFDFSSAKGNVKQWIATAMAITGTPAKWLNALYTLAMHESGGNPHAINLWDSNAKAGHPSKGLMQTIDSTFNRYKLPGLDDIWNPVHNAVAAIRYMLDRYGSIGNVPGIRNLARGRGYVGYADGTPSSGHPGGPAIVGEQGEELGYIPGKGFVLLGLKGPMLLNLPKGTSILPHKFTEPLLRSYGFPAYADGVGDFPVIPAIDALSRKTESQTVDKLTTVLDKLTRILSGSGEKTDSTYVIEVRSIIDGREVAKATAKYTDEEIRRNKLNRNRALGKVSLNG